MAVYKELLAYKKVFELALEIQIVTKTFPPEERFALTDQIRRCSRSVCANMAEGFRKIKYRAHFVSKLTDADMKNSETSVWLEFGFAFGYLSQEQYQNLTNKNEEVVRLLFHIIENPERYGAK